MEPELQNNFNWRPGGWNPLELLHQVAIVQIAARFAVFRARVNCYFSIWRGRCLPSLVTLWKSLLSPMEQY